MHRPGQPGGEESTGRPDAQIYSQAHRVVVFPGLDTQYSSQAVQALRKLGMDNDIDARRACWMPSPDADVQTIKRIRASDWSPYGLNFLEPIHKLLGHQWLSRLWASHILWNKKHI
jgi:hypothetical protein